MASKRPPPPKRKAPRKDPHAWKSKFFQAWRANLDMDFALRQVKKEPWDLREALYTDAEFAGNFTTMKWYSTELLEERQKAAGRGEVEMTETQRKAGLSVLQANNPAYIPRKVEKVYVESKSEVKQEVKTTQAVETPPEPARIAEDIKAQFRLLEGRRGGV